jgi:hypothetical protein
MAGVRRDHFGHGRRNFVGGDYGLGCPYYTRYSWPYTCNY